MNSQQRPIIYAVLGVAVAALAIAVLGLLVRTWSTTDLIRESQVTNTRARESSDRTLAAIEDCTKPAGECFKRGQKSQANAISDINRVTILASACSAGLPSGLSVAERQTRIYSCVVDRLAAENPQP